MLKIDRGSPDRLVVIPGQAEGIVNYDVVPSLDYDADTQSEIRLSTRNGRVGSMLVSASDRVRIWHITLDPGDRLKFHRHVLDYFWTTTMRGKARSRYPDGSFTDTEHAVGSTQNYRIEKGGAILHDLQNIGDTVLGFVTVEFLDSANAPLPLPTTESII
jgi:hypothetical protein